MNHREWSRWFANRTFTIETKDEIDQLIHLRKNSNQIIICSELLEKAIEKESLKLYYQHQMEGNERQNNNNPQVPQDQRNVQQTGARRDRISEDPVRLKRVDEGAVSAQDHLGVACGEYSLARRVAVVVVQT